ncbi:MAG: NnrS family protein [Verrucomicrobiales bacterium]
MNLAAYAKEPFRIFFPLGVLAGMLGVALWPLHFWQAMEWYPGQVHARIMAFGLFGAFIIGFLGTAMPRMLSAKPLRPAEVISLAIMFVLMISAYMFGADRKGDILWLALMALFAGILRSRFGARKDTPPPGFVLVAMSWLCVLSGGVISVLSHYKELDLFWLNLQKLLSYQGFVLLPIIGIGPFILPRFFGLKSAHDFPEMLKPSSDWSRKAALALCAGLAIIASFILEADGSFRSGYALRFAVVAIYGFLEMPWKTGPNARNPLGISIRLAFVTLCAGFLAVAIMPEYRTGLLHLTLIGGFTIMTFAVATRVVFGHSGNIAKLKGKNRWILISFGLMLFGMATRISGDFWPNIMQSHYIYGAILWIVSAGIWAAYVLPKVMRFDEGE